MTDPRGEAHPAHYFFHGRILPDRAHVRLNYPAQGVKMGGHDLVFKLFAFGSEFNGLLQSQKPIPTLTEVSAILKSMLRSILDRWSFAYICAYDFDLVGAVRASTGEAQIFGVNEPVFYTDIDEQLKYTEKQISFLDELVGLSLHEVRLDHALRCFNHAMRDQALVTPLFCYLAIEALAYLVVEIARGGKVARVDNPEWEIFRRTLRIKRDTLTSDFKALPDRFRHGDFVDTSWDERKKALGLAWEIIRRSIHFIKIRTALSEAEFPEI